MDYPTYDNIITLESMCKDAFEAGGGPRIQEQPGKGKLTARERFDLLLDEGTLEGFGIFKVGGLLRKRTAFSR